MQIAFKFLVTAAIVTFAAAQFCNSTHGCSGHGKCVGEGSLCLCEQFYFGLNCSQSVPVNERPKFVTIGVEGTALALIILAWMFLPPIVGLLICLLIRYTCEKPNGK
eukprot:TRINITY_DN0_c2116_g1_i1.p1 TRINITY_DN0_c2116_g1~~TRINITY_DN0_c2116_g1_i1.p1  ORF type:complete len:107 (-),score=5.59 TRINITY_DN0_c2116_g1_i1:156-476(-)